MQRVWELLKSTATVHAPQTRDRAHELRELIWKVQAACEDDSMIDLLKRAEGMASALEMAAGACQQNVAEAILLMRELDLPEAG